MMFQTDSQILAIMFHTVRHLVIDAIRAYEPQLFKAIKANPKLPLFGAYAHWVTESLRSHRVGLRFGVV